MRRHAGSTVIVLLAVSIPPLAGCGGDESGTVAVDLSATPSVEAVSLPESTGGDETDTVAVDLSATPSVEAVSLPESIGVGAAISPDGSLLAFAERDGVCVVATAGGQPRCAPFDAVTDLRNVSFSPDNARLVFTEDLVRVLQEPDIWSLDVESMTLTNHTDDGVVEVSLSEDDGATLLDQAPALTADGEIVFVRGRPSRDGVQLLRLGDDGEPTEVATLPSEGPVSFVFPLVPLRDGDLLAISSPPPGDGAELFRIDAESGEVATVATFGEDEFRLPRIVDVHGSMVLVMSEEVVGMGRPGFTSHVIVDLDTGDVVPVFPADRMDGDVSLQPSTAAFTPDGSSVVFAAMAERSVLRSVEVVPLLDDPATAPVRRLVDLVGAIPAVEGGGGGELEPMWSPVVPLRWTATGELIGVVGFEQVATVTFGDPG